MGEGGSPDPTVSDPFLDWGDNSLTGNLYNGMFEILKSNPYLSNPGKLRLVAKDGLVTEREVSGDFSSVDGLLPSVGSPASFDIPFTDAFPSEISLDYDFAPLLVNYPEVDAEFELDGGSGVPVPGPLSLMGLGVAFAYSRNMRTRIKSRTSASRYTL
jgi:hypothetical protein